VQEANDSPPLQTKDREHRSRRSNPCDGLAVLRRRTRTGLSRLPAPDQEGVRRTVASFRPGNALGRGLLQGGGVGPEAASERFGGSHEQHLDRSEERRHDKASDDTTTAGTGAQDITKRPPPLGGAGRHRSRRAARLWRGVGARRDGSDSNSWSDPSSSLCRQLQASAGSARWPDAPDSPHAHVQLQCHPRARPNGPFHSHLVGPRTTMSAE